MGHLMPHMSEQGPVWFVQVYPAPFALHVVSLGDIDGNYPVQMTRQQGGFPRNIANQFETKRRAIFGGQPIQWKLQPHDGINDAAFGNFQLVPAFRVSWDRQIWNQIVEAAGNAK